MKGSSQMDMPIVRHIPLRLACLASAMIGSPAQAQDDTQAWGSVIATGPVRGDLFVWLEAQARATDDVGGGSQVKTNREQRIGIKPLLRASRNEMGDGA